MMIQMISCAGLVLSGALSAASFQDEPTPVPHDAPIAQADPPQAEAKTAGQGDSRYEKYVEVRANALKWLNELKVDPIELHEAEVAGIKKLGEILEAYVHLRNSARSEPERKAIIDRATQLARQTDRPAYHNILHECDEAEFKESSMSYFRVASLMEEFDLDTTKYREEMRRLKPRMDDHMNKRGSWQRNHFRRHYQHFGLELPPLLQEDAPSDDIVDQRKPFEEFKLSDWYDVTHVVFVAYNYGRKKTTNEFDADDRAYLRQPMRGLVEKCIEARYPDLMSELLSCYVYLGWREDPAANEVVDFLLENQLPSGTWGEYEVLRPKYGDLLEQQMYLHTTSVSVRALVEYFDQDWPTADDL